MLGIILYESCELIYYSGVLLFKGVQNISSLLVSSASTNNNRKNQNEHQYISLTKEEYNKLLERIENLEQKNT